MAIDNMDNKGVDSFGIPEAPESVKATPKYSIDQARAIWKRYERNRTEISSSWISYFTEARAYAMGRQTPDRYKTFMAGASSNTSSETVDSISTVSARDYSRRGYLNVNWNDIVSPLPNLLSTIRGNFSDQDWDIKADAVDIDSGDAEMQRMMDSVIDAHPVFGKMLNDLKGSMSIPPEEPAYVPESLADAEEARADGLFKDQQVQSIEKLLLHSENASNWDRTLKDQLVTDLSVLGYAFAYPEFAHETCVPTWRHASVDKVVMQYSTDSLFSDSDYAGVQEEWTISKLKQFRNQIYKSDGSKIDEEGFKEIAHKYAGLSGNPDENEWAKFGKELSYGMDYDNFKVKVLVTWWKDVVNQKRVEYTNKYGHVRLYDYEEPESGEYDIQPGENNVMYKTPRKGNYSLNIESLPGAKISKTTKRNDGFSLSANTPGKIKYSAKMNIGKDEQLKEIRIRRLYHCYWIVGSEYCIKFGPVPNQPRYPYSEPLLPLVGYRLPDRAVILRSIPIADLYQIAWLRLQNGLAKASQGGYAINISLLGEAGNKKLDPMKVLKLWRESQVLFYKMGLNGNVGGTPVPITYLPGNLQEIISNELAVLNNCMKLLEDLTGFSMIALGQTPSPETGLGVTERTLQSTQKSITPIATGLRYLKEELAKRTSCMYQMAIKNDERARMQYSKVIGSEAVELIRKSTSLDMGYGISLRARPDNDMKQAVIQAATVAAQSKEITADERLFIIEQVTSGQNLREIRQKLRKMIKANKQLEHQMQLENIDRQNKGLQESAMQQEQMKQQTEMAKLKMKDAETRLQAMSDIAIRDHDSFRKIKEMEAQKALELG